jgi:Cu-Zn family superoxide dismutase
VEGLSDGKHAVHIHETGACEPCSAAKGHHDPGPFGQTRPDSAGDAVPATDINHPYHMGDLINIEVKNGRGSMKHTTNRVTLSAGRLSILDEDGSAFIIHTNEDTYCDHESDLKKGCAGGPRDACGIILAD